LQKQLKFENISVNKVSSRNCKTLQRFEGGPSGIYNISAGRGDSSVVTVYCDQERDGGGWLVSAHAV